MQFWLIFKPKTNNKVQHKKTYVALLINLTLTKVCTNFD